MVSRPVWVKRVLEFPVLSSRTLYFSEPFLYSILYPVTLGTSSFCPGVSHETIVDVGDAGAARRFTGGFGVIVSGFTLRESAWILSLSVSATYSRFFEASSASPAGELNWPSPVPDLPNFSTKQTPSATLSVPEGHVFFSTS